MKAKANVVVTDAKFNPVTPNYLPESVTVDSLVHDLSHFCSLEDLVIALNSLIQNAELSNQFAAGRRRRSLQIATLFFHDVLNIEYGSLTFSMMRRLFEREWANIIDFSTTDLLESLDQVIDEFVMSNNTTEQDLKELEIVRAVRNQLITSHLGPEAMKLSMSLIV